ncbi:LPD3 domain-containing protein [Histophilus somni]|uniref:LPD3 domain-containing protein n=1 Tax=Histophilus somni TaxID=731 RepID=UPI0014474C02|nr:LPD38 domain-containing protein [Histophilus somni]
MSNFSLSNEEFQYLQKNILGIAPNATGSRGRGQSDVADEGSSSIDVIANQYKLPEEQGFFADVVDSVQMGAWRGAGDLARGIGALFNSEWLNKAADYAYYNAEENKATMSSKMQEALGQSAFDGWNEETGEGKGLLNMYWWAGNLGALLGENIDTVLTMGAGKLATTGIKAGGKLAGKYFSKEVADQVGKAAVKQASRFGIPAQYHKTIAYTAIASAMSAGNRANQVREELSQISDNDLAQHNDFRIAYWDLKESDEGQTLSDHEIFEQARQQYYNKVGRDAILNPLAIAADITANAVGGLGGGLWGLPKVNKWLGKPTQSVKEGVLKGAFIESATEGLQGAAEQYAINDTARDYYDSDRSLTEGMSENIADGMVLGAGFGGLTGGYEAMSHRRTMNREKKRLLEAVNTGDERVDAQIRYQVEAYNKIANDLDELISPQRIQTLNQFGLQAVEKARRREQIEAELRGETQAQAEKQQAEQVQTVTDTPYHQCNLADIQAEFIQHGLDENDFNDFLEANLQQATADLQKLQANPFKMGTDLQKSLAEKQAYNAKLADTQARVDYWTQAKTAPKFGTEATQAESAVQAESGVNLDPFLEDVKFSRSTPSGYVRDLMVTHNISPEGVLHAQKMGGLPYASVAVTKQDTPVMNFGDITLIGDRHYVDPKGKNKASVFGADIYSPRYPNVHYEYKDSDKQTLRALFAQSAKDIEDFEFDYNFNQGLSQTGVRKALLESDAVKHQFLKENGIEYEPVYRTITKSNYADFQAVKKASELGLTGSDLKSDQLISQHEVLLREFIQEDIQRLKRATSPLARRILLLAENSLNGDLKALREYVVPRLTEALNNRTERQKLDVSATKSAMREAVEQHKPAFNQYIENIATQFVAKEKIRKGENRDGKATYMAHTLENVVKKLKKEVRGGESINYGLPTLRSKVTPQFKSISEIQDNKVSLVSHSDFKKVKDEIEVEKDKLAEHLGMSSWNIDEVLFQVVNDGVSSAFHSAKIENTPQNRQLIADFLTKLETMPTEYFEGKAKDISQFSDFKGAVIPQDLTPDVRQVLEQAGLALYEYDRGNPNARAEIIKQASNELDILHNGDVLFSRATYKPERLEKLRQAKPIEITGKEIQPSDDLRQYKRNALEYGKSLRGAYTNKDTGREINIGRASITEILRHDYKDVEHLQSIAAIPKIIENAVYIDTLPNKEVRKNPDVKEYEYYLAGLKIGGEDYTVRAVIGVSTTGDKYYDHKLTKIEKGNLLEMTSRVSTAEISSSSPLSSINDKRLLQILQQQTKSFDFSQEKSQIAEAVGKGLSTHFEVVHSSELGINDPTIEAAYNTQTGKIVIIADNIRANDILTREERLKWVAWHELAHRGLQVRYGKDFQALMEQADRNTTVRDLATALQKDRVELRNNRTLAVEEAIAELHAAYTTGKMEELKSRYGLVVPRGREISLKSWFRITAERIRAFMVKLFGREKANRFSHDELLNLLKDIQQSAGGDIHEADNNTRYSLNEDPNSDFANAIPKRTATSYDEARSIVSELLGEPLVNKETGMVATISRRSLDKLLSGKAVDKSTNLKDHLTAVANIDQLFENAIQGWVEADKNNDPNIAGVHRLFAPLSIDGQIRLAKLTVKAMSFNQGNRVYSVETIEVENKNSDLSLSWKPQLSENTQLTSQQIANVQSLIQRIQKFNSGDQTYRFSRSSTYQSGDNISVLELSRGGNIQAPKWTDKFSTLQALKETFHQGTAKLDEWFADSLRPVNDWIDNMQFSDHTSNKSGRDHEKRRLKDAMYTAKGRRDALNSEFEVHYLNPILSKIAEIAKRSQGKINEETAKRKAGFWVSARYSIEKNMELLSIDEKAMQEAQTALNEAQVNGTAEDIRKAKNAFNSAEKHYLDRKAAVWNKDFNNKHFKAGVAGGWSIPEAKEIMRNIERDISLRDLTAIGDLIAELNQARLEIDYKSGRLTDTEYQQFKANRHYVPLTGDPNAQLDDMDFIAGAGANSLNIAKDKTLKGRTNSEAEDAIDAIWKAVGKSTTYAGWSEFKGKLDALLETEVSLLEQQGYSNVEAQRLAGQNLGIGKQKMQGLTRSSDNVLIARRGGVYYEYSLPNNVIAALKNDNVEQANDFLNVLSKPTRWYARGVTQWSLAFAPINMLRDTWEKSEFIRVQKVYDRQGKLLSSDKMDQIGRATALSPLTNPAIWAATKRFAFGQELRDSVLEEKLLKQLLKEGAISTYGTYLERTEADLLKRIKRENSVLGSKIDKAMGVIESYNQTFDMVSALSAYKALVDNGVDSKQAAATTLELTNFRKTGSKMRGIKALYMFSQPTVMGAANLIRYLSTKKGQIRFLTYTAGMMALYSLLRSMDDEDEAGNKMDQLGDITRFIPIPIGNGNYIKLPVGFGMPQMAWNFATNIVKGAVSDISFMEAGVNMVTHATKTFAPVSPSEISALKYPLEKLALTFTPSILQPLMQNALNRSAFGSQITTNFVRQDKLKAEQSKSTTAQFWKDLAIDIQQTLGLDMHPEQIKNLFDGYSGMLGSLKELNTWLVENPNREQLGRNTRTLFINQLYGAGNEFAVQSRYYEASEEAQQVAKEYAYRKLNKQLDREWLTPERQELIKWHEYNLRTMGKLRSEKAQLTKQLRAGKISAHAYEQRLKRYNEAVNSVQKKLLSGYRQMVGLSSY